MTMILVYTGNGKGKTSACVGQALRALGQGMAVAFGQFMKRPDQAGEQRMLKQLLGGRFLAGGKGFFRHEHEREEHRQAALALLAWAESLLPGIDMLVLDESLYALGAGLLREEELRGVINRCREGGVHLVLSGRGLPDWLLEAADIVSELREVKHAFASGQPAQKGIEF
jgi:cob(I)alamin adenosyltransferase